MIKAFQTEKLSNMQLAHLLLFATKNENKYKILSDEDFNKYSFYKKKLSSYYFALFSVFSLVNWSIYKYLGFFKPNPRKKWRIRFKQISAITIPSFVISHFML